ncbi:MAG: metallophosphoesterase [Flavobacteriales bacterium]|nr:metallophosphoesterase [Flavobacteriales bacterium]MCB9448028.1 metallophosphoesterase [Flavobacteriales bacterium]
MRTFPYITILVLALFILLLDAYAYRGWKKLSWPLPKRVLQILTGIYWSYTVVFIGYMLWLSYHFRGNYNPQMHVRASYLFGMGLVSAIPKIIFNLFQLADDFRWLINKLARRFRSEPVGIPGTPMDRATFLTKAGLGVAAIPFIGISYGILKGRYDFRVLKETLELPNLPNAFDGFRIVQISDLHIGSFDKDFDAVKVGLEMANREMGDVMLFTGDLVNNFSAELDGWLPYLEQFEAKHGRYSSLGNHDYGDYSNWDSPEDKARNFNEVVGMHEAIGFDLLRNENRILERGGERIALVGVENWGKPPFHQYGDLSKALQGIPEDIPFKVLMSHDPSHWDAQVLGQTDIDLTLAGHTHGAQFGVESTTLGLKWSPVQYKYPRWAGMYSEGKQHLYVNRGFGFLGFPGRVGMAPEITVIELRKKA